MTALAHPDDAPKRLASDSEIAVARTAEFIAHFDSVEAVGSDVTLFERRRPGATAALRLWASSRGLPVTVTSLMSDDVQWSVHRVGVLGAWEIVVLAPAETRLRGLTADTITDDQIRELLSSDDIGERHTASCALFADNGRRAERARCAKILNAREASK